MSPVDPDVVRDQVRKRYASIVKSGCGCGSTCCTPSENNSPQMSAELGYSEQEINSTPQGANMGLGCGNPQAIANLKPGETVLDLGCGGGFDCFLAARQVGETGKVIGIDMTPDMISKARANAKEGRFTNVEFRLGEIEHLPVADDSVDVIISNCVINLSPDKLQVYREAFRVLRTGGRLAISDVVAIRDLPDEIKSDLDVHSGCVAGAISVADIERMLSATGFSQVRIDIKHESQEFIKDWFPGSGIEDYVRSATVEARKKG
ncbi:MAG TPA: arsenite methyltransferase [bacterium]|nr:arsenite methyltransferase [bacterium]HQL60703.1 arsenite methyltransferase [bacterium]